MDWIINNKEWIFSGIGITVLGIIYKLISSKKDNSDLISNKISNNGNNTSSSSNTNNININIPHEQKKESLVKGKYSKENVQILFIDDQEFKTVENLITAGWHNTKTIKDVTNMDCIDVKNANIIFVDINGVGGVLFPKDQGLGLAEALKRKYPEKHIVLYSAQEKGDRFHRALKVVDSTLSKNAEPYEFINIIENFIS
ncbi:MAG: response regulator [Paludibacter sp.]